LDMREEGRITPDVGRGAYDMIAIIVVGDDMNFEVRVRDPRQRKTRSGPPRRAVPAVAPQDGSGRGVNKRPKHHRNEL
jgi:hypothetical protein